MSPGHELVFERRPLRALGHLALAAIVAYGCYRALLTGGNLAVLAVVGIVLAGWLLARALQWFDVLDLSGRLPEPPQDREGFLAHRPWITRTWTQSSLFTPAPLTDLHQQLVTGLATLTGAWFFRDFALRRVESDPTAPALAATGMTALAALFALIGLFACYRVLRTARWMKQYKAATGRWPTT